MNNPLDAVKPTQDEIDMLREEIAIVSEEKDIDVALALAEVFGNPHTLAKEIIALRQRLAEQGG